jgi:pyruvate dehydrogenase E2 component (dihydrolipoamide acetyltransferase)
MAFEVVMPRLGWNMESGSLAEWLKADGEHVEAGELLFSVESDKAIQEVEALESGILRIPPGSPAPGQEVPVGALLAYLVAPGEEMPSSAQGAIAAPPAQAPAAEPLPPLQAEAAPVSASAYPPAPLSAGRRPAISPRAARIASELGVDWSRLKGSGRTGRIVERDVRQAAAVVHAQKEALPTPAAPLSAPAAGDVLLPLSPVRRLIAERMSTSAHTSAPVTLTAEADATELVHIRKRMAQDGAPILPSYTDFLILLVAQVLMEHPMLNARFEGDSILQPKDVHMGIAVDTERGLLTPVLRKAQVKSLRQIARESSALIERARLGHLTLDEQQGGTFTLTNLGMYEIDAFTPILHLPQTAILGLGRVHPKPVVVDPESEQVAVRHMLFLSLTFDHRLVDGAPAARFLQVVKSLVEHPWKAIW